MSASKKTFPRTQLFVLGLQFIGDAAFSFLGLCAAYFLRFETPLRHLGVWAGNAERDFNNYLPLLVLGTLFFVASYSYLKLYDGRLLLRPQRSFLIVVKAIAFWLVAFLGTSLVFKLEPAVSRIFAFLSCGTTLLCMGVWHAIFHAWLARSEIRTRLVQKVAIVGWTSDAAGLVEAIGQDTRHPYHIAGVVLPEDASEHPRNLKVLGTLSDLPQLLRTPEIDVVIVADLSLSRHQIMEIAKVCEITYTDFKIVPSFFQIFLSNLRMQSVSGMPILGVEDLPIQQLPNVILKRLIDITGALVGLVGAIPIMLVLAWLIYRESPGPIIYKQTRTGLHGRPFSIYKLRSMRLDAEKQGAQWAVEGDPRRLKIGTFMREWNLDELPQFWNVLRGDMSLVGPRPERPELIAQFEQEIPHYNPRHEVRPGVTGWAQVHGLRGNTSLVDRIRYDLYYIENWSIWLDFQIMVMTFFKRQNAY